jgi:hypothetical protein
LELEEDAYIVKLSLEWLYTGKYTCKPRIVESATIMKGEHQSIRIPVSPESLLGTHAKVYALATKWILRDLQLEACNRYGSAIITGGLSDAFVPSLRIICDQNESYTGNKIACMALEYAALKFNDLINLESFCQFLTGRGDVAVAMGKLRAKLVASPTAVIQSSTISIPKCPNALMTPMSECHPRMRSQLSEPQDCSSVLSASTISEEYRRIWRACAVAMLAYQ